MESVPNPRQAQTFHLSSIVCPVCGGSIDGVISNVRPASATTFDSCLRRCEKCGVGVSNTSGKQPTFIYRDPMANISADIPDEFRSGALKVLSQALNVRSRVSKRYRFGFSTSEDAVTWVVFSYLLRSGRLLSALQGAGLLPNVAPQTVPTLLLWGSPLDAQLRGRMIADQLAALCDELGEDSDRRSEPDVIVDLGPSGLIFIEVKFQSGNDCLNPKSPKWSRYDSASWLNWRLDDVSASGCYELARNWCLMKGLANTRPATLVNLGPARLFAGSEGARLARFVRGLDTDGQSQFKSVTWADLLEPILADAPSWFVRFCRSDRKLVDAEPH